jgi:hypothetical protein
MLITTTWRSRLAVCAQAGKQADAANSLRVSRRFTLSLSEARMYSLLRRCAKLGAISYQPSAFSFTARSAEG